MPDIREGQLMLSFSDEWRAIKYDETDWHEEHMKSRPKAMDVLAHADSGVHWWIEVKDCMGYEQANRPRLSGKEPAEVEQVRQWARRQGIYAAVAIHRRKPFIVDEVEQKVRDTLATMAVARRENAPELAAFDIMNGREAPVIKVVLLLTWDRQNFAGLAKRLNGKLRKALRPYGITDCAVVDEQRIQTYNGLDCSVTRDNT